MTVEATAPLPAVGAPEPQRWDELLPPIPPPAQMTLAAYLQWRRTELAVVPPELLLDAVNLILDDLVGQYGQLERNESGSTWFEESGRG